MENLGKANVKVEILDGLPGIDKEATKFNFDISAFNYNVLKNSAYFPPVLTEQVADEMDQFAACFPSKRKTYIDNFITYADGTNLVPESTELPYILWKATSVREGMAVDAFDNYDTYNLIQPVAYLKDYPSDYNGPKWADAALSALAPSNDELAIKQWYKFVTEKASAADITEATKTTTTSTTTLIEYTPPFGWVNQHTVKDGLWWAIESNPFLNENMPFWVNLQITRTPSTRTHDTVFIISLGLDDDEQSYDIYISHNNKPRIIDYYNGRKQMTTSGKVPTNEKEFDLDFSRVLDSQDIIEIGVITIAARLVVFINQTPLIYNRIDKSEGDEGGKLKEAKIAAGKIKIYGSNVQAVINVCPMRFAPLSIMAMPIPTISRNNDSQTQIVYHGVTNKGDFSGPVCKLPQQPDKAGSLYGVDCLTFSGEGGNANPTGIGFHRNGNISFFKAATEGITSLPSSDFYIFTMTPDDTEYKTNNNTFTISNGGAPYFFRIKGGAKRPRDLEPLSIKVAEDVLTASESLSTSDYFSARATATVELYNKGGKYDYLRNEQYGIRISWGWGNQTKKTFLGMVVSASTSEVPGKEIITLNCEDYMTILKNTPIVNSPFYDGMIGVFAIEDLAKRAGITKFVKDWDNEDDYFLPSGYAFSKPLMRFDSSKMLFDCMIDIVKRFEAFIYFDEEGQLHINKLPGGLFSDTSGGSFAAEFVRDPDADPSQIILNQKNIDYDFASTCNRISALTLDRDTRNAILYTKSATGNEDNIRYRKVMLYNQAALGSIEVARKYINDLSQRIFYPVRKTAFTTAGSIDTSIAKIFDFIKVDDQEYRLLSLSRKYSADENSFTNDYNGEWLGGK